MAESSINKSIVVAQEPEVGVTGSNTSFPDAVKELGEALHKRYPNRTSNLSGKNVKGLLKIDVLNEYMIKNFGYKYETLSILSQMKVQRTVSVKGWGADKFIELVKGIQATFEQTEIPTRLSQMLRR